MARTTSVSDNPFLNLGRQRNFITGIQGVSAGGQAQVNLSCDRRFHRLNFQCTAINYTGGTALTVTKITSSAGAGATVTPTLSNRAVASVAVVAGGTGWTVGDTFTFTDATGTGFIGTVATVTGGPPGAIATATVTVRGTPSAIDPAIMLGTCKLLVNGVNVADLTADQEIKRALMNGSSGGQTVTIGSGQFPVFFTEPWRTWTPWPEITSWDMAGQRTFQVTLAINAGIDTPGITGDYEFDFIRNTVQGPIDAITYQTMIAAGTAPAPLLMPISRHAFTFQLNAGLNLINTVPITYPILRLHMLGSTPGNLLQFELDQDANKAEEGYIITQNSGAQLGQLIEQQKEYGFDTTKFDYSYISDNTQRIQSALKVQSSMNLKIYSNVAQSVTIIQEKLPKSYAS